MNGLHDCHEYCAPPYHHGIGAWYMHDIVYVGSSDRPPANAPERAVHPVMHPRDCYGPTMTATVLTSVVPPGWAWADALSKMFSHYIISSSSFKAGLRGIPLMFPATSRRDVADGLRGCVTGAGCPFRGGEGKLI